MAIPYWPSDLPQRVLANNFSETLADGRLRTAMETGHAKSRRRFSSAPKPISVAFRVTLDQKARLERFWNEEIANGSLPFLIADQTMDGMPLMADAGLWLLDDQGRPLIVTAWWLVLAGDSPPVFTPRNRETSYTAAFPLMVMPLMGRVVSLNARAAANAEQTDQVPVLLVTIRHASLPEPAYLSSDPTERISADPLVYGTRHQTKVFGFVLMGAVLPDDQKDSPPKTTLVFENVDRDMAKAIRSITPGTYASIDLTVVLAGTPETVEARFTNLRGVRGTYDASQVSLDVSREPFTSEPLPAGRMTVDRFPGLHN